VFFGRRVNAEKSSAVQQRVFMVSSPDGAIVLDTEAVTADGKTGSLFKFDELGLEMWMLLCAGRSDSEVVDHFLREYDVEKTVVERDLAKLLEEASHRGLDRNAVRLSLPQETTNRASLPSFPWQAPDADASRPVPTNIMRVTATIGLWAFNFILSRMSLALLFRTVKHWPVTGSTPTAERPALIGQICTAVDGQSIWCRKETLCLLRSAVTTCMLRTWGLPAELIVAVKCPRLRYQT
jgi:hypothetical protein